VVRSLLVIGVVVAVGIAAVVHGVLGGDDGTRAAEPQVAAEAEVAGVDVPQPGALPGSLAYLDGECRLQQLDFAALTTQEGPASRSCAYWLSPAGDLAVVTSGSDRGGRVHRLDADGTSAPLETFEGEASWSPDGTRIAWCSSSTTSVLSLRDGVIESVRGCRPAFAPSGDLLSVTEADGEEELLRNGDSMLGPHELRSGFPPAAGPVTVLGYDERSDGLLAVAVASGFEPRPPLDAESDSDLASAGPFGAVNARPDGAYRRFVLQLWRGRELEQVVSLRGLAYPFVNLAFGELVRFSPRGDELAIGSSGVGVPVMLVDVETLEPRLRPTVQNGFSWSPDGAWFALADQLGIRVAGAVRDLATYVLPIQASSLAWR
jgi:hypothetical protein